MLFFVPGAVLSQNGVMPGAGSWIFRNQSPGGHRGRVTSIQYDGERFLSAGEDGFLETWDSRGRQALSRYQLSGLPIQTMVCRPGKSQIACIENDGLGQQRISVWDYRSLKNLFTLRFRDPVQSISYSAGGSYLLIARSGSTGIVLADPETGELLLDPGDIPGEFPSSVSFAAIGRTERVMLVYSPAGSLSYWELRWEENPRLVPSLDHLGLPLNFEVPAGLSSPILFGNNLFFAGFDQEGLVLLRADTGSVLGRDSSVTRGQLAGEGNDLYCLVPAGISGRGNSAGAGNSPGTTAAESEGTGIYRFRVNNFGYLERREFRSFPSGLAANTLALVPGERSSSLPLVALGTTGGGLLPLTSLSQLSTARIQETKKQTPIPEAAVGSETIAFLSGGNRLGYIPLDFSALRNGTALILEPAGEYSRITAAGTVPGAPRGDSPPGGPELEPSPAPAIDRFLLWQDKSPLPVPALRFPGDGGNAMTLSGLGGGQPSPAGSRNPGRFLLRSVSVLGDRGLFLDTGGNISVLSLLNGEGLYTETSIGSMDGTFIDQDTIILGRSAPASGGTIAPFLKIDTRTSETVPIPYSASVGAQVYRGSSGRIYGVTVENTERDLWTSIIRLDTQDPDQSVRLVEYRGEDARFSIAETEGFIASTLGGTGAGIYAPWGVISLDRGPGLPLRIADGDLYFVILDSEGCVSWHDPRTGEILALFRLYEDEWSLATAWAGPLRGRVIRR
jgi:hypothetical protein